MGRLIGYELEKLFQRKLVWIVIVILLLLNGLLAARQAAGNQAGYTGRDVAAVYEDLQAMPREEALSQLQERMDWLIGRIMEQNFSLEGYPYPAYQESLPQELGLISHVYDQVSAAGDYDGYLDYVDSQAEQLTQFALFARPDTFSYRNAQRTAAVYDRLRGTTVTWNVSDGVKLVTDWRLTDVFLLLAIGVLLLHLLVSEREEGTIFLIKPTKRGYGATIGAKAAAIALVVLALTVGFYGLNLLLGWRLIGLGDLSRAIQSLDGYLSSPFPLTVGEYLLCFFAGKYVGLLAVTAVFFLLCVVLRNTVYPLLAGAGLLGVEFLLWRRIDVHSWLSPLSQCNLLRLMDTGGFFAAYTNLNLMGWPVNSFLVGWVMAAAVIVLCTILAVHRFCRETAADRQRLPTLRRNRRWRPRRIHTSLFRHEGFKLLVTNRGLILFLLLLLLQVGSYGNQSYYTTEDEYYDRLYAEQLAGPITQETWERLEAEEERFSEADRQIAELNRKLAAGELGEQGYANAVDQVKIPDARRMAFDRARDQVETLAQHEDEPVEYLLQTGWNALLGESGRRVDAADAGKLLFVLILAFSSVFSQEYTRGVDNLLRVCSRGEWGVAWRKLLLCGLYAVAAALSCFLPRFLSVVAHYQMDILGTSAHSVLLLERTPSGISLFLWLACFFLCRCLGAAICGGVILFFSRWTRNPVATMLCSAVLLLIPAALFLMGICGQIGLLPLVTGRVMLPG